MRILLIEVIDEDRGDDVEVLYPPLGLGYLAGYIRKKRPDWDVRIVRGDSFKYSGMKHPTGFKGCDLEGCKEEGCCFNPDVVGLSFVSQNAERAVNAVRKIRSEWKDVPIVAGGHHVTAFPWWLSERTGEQVYSVMGEGERAFYSFCLAVKEKKSFRNIPGVGYSIIDSDVVDYKMNGVLSSDEPLDNLPMPTWDKFVFERGEAHIFTSRGCPFDCVFCSSSCFWGKTRYHSPMRVYNEIRELHLEHGVGAINIYDDLFAVNSKRVGAIRNLVMKDPRLRDAGIRFSCLGRASALTDRILEELKGLGVAAMAFGFESGSDRVLKYLKGPSASVESNVRAAKMVKAAGIGLVGSVIYGVPGETMEEALQTVLMVKEMDMGIGEAYLATPYPGTQLWNDAELHELVSDDMDFSRLRFDWGDDAVVVGNLSMSQLKEIRERYQEIFGR